MGRKMYVQETPILSIQIAISLFTYRTEILVRKVILIQLQNVMLLLYVRIPL